MSYSGFGEQLSSATTSVDDVIDRIWTMDDKEINRVIKAINGRRDQIVRRRTYSLSRGDKVFFYHKGRKVNGVITKTNQKTCKVRTEDGMKWTVTSTLLKRR